MLAAQWKEAGSMPNAGHLEAVELSSNNWSRVKGKKGAYCNIMFYSFHQKALCQNHLRVDLCQNVVVRHRCWDVGSKRLLH